MNYKKVYEVIIHNRQLNPCDGYIERHHIIPKSLGGGDDSGNIVALTAREHFVCHCLLAKMYPEESFEWHKMNHAFMMMKCNSLTQNRYFNSRLYESLRGNFISVMAFAQSGQRNSQYGSMWICNVELQENRKVSKTDDIPDGWVKGRNRWKQSTKTIRNREKFIEFLSDLSDKDIEVYNKLEYRKIPTPVNFDTIKEEIACYKFMVSMGDLKNTETIKKIFPLMSKQRITKLLKLTECKLEEKRGGFRKETTTEYKLRCGQIGKVTCL